MRELWSSAEMQAGRMADWVFLNEEAEMMRRAIAARQPATSLDDR
jgi:hypothetical protein